MWHVLELNLICQVSAHLSKEDNYFAAYRSHLEIYSTVHNMHYVNYISSVCLSVTLFLRVFMFVFFCTVFIVLWVLLIQIISLIEYS